MSELPPHGKLWSRRSTLLGALCAAVVAGGRSAFGQPAPVKPEPEDESRWARMGVSLAGKTALVTGSTDGLGREVARQLGALGATVIVHGRNVERGAQVVSGIEAAGRGSAVFYRADFASLAEVRTLAATVLEKHERLDLLINNAGLGMARGTPRQLSADGHELLFAVNYLAGFLLSRLLLPRLEASAPARIVNVSSGGQTPLDFDDLMLVDTYTPNRAYAQSKLAQIMFTIDLAAQLDPAKVTVNSLHPARSMDTTMLRQMGAQPVSTVAEGAEAVMQLAVSPELASRTGSYFNGLNEARANLQAYDVAARARLWALSSKLTRL